MWKDLPKRRSFRRAHPAAVCLAMLSAIACGGGGDAGDDESSGSDGAFQPDGCLIEWYGPNSAGSDVYNVYVVDLPVENWADGSYGFEVDGAGGNLGLFFYGVEAGGELEDAVAVGIATNGTFQVTSEGTSEGDAVGFQQPAKTQYFAYDVDEGTLGASLGSGGIGSFSGVWSDPDALDSSDVSAGEGEVAFPNLVNGSDLGSLGSLLTFGICYELPSEAPRGGDR